MVYSYPAVFSGGYQAGADSVSTLFTLSAYAAVCPRTLSFLIHFLHQLHAC